MRDIPTVGEKVNNLSGEYFGTVKSVTDRMFEVEYVFPSRRVTLKYHLSDYEHMKCPTFSETFPTPH